MNNSSGRISHLIFVFQIKSNLCQNIFQFLDSVQHIIGIELGNTNNLLFQHHFHAEFVLEKFKHIF